MMTSEQYVKMKRDEAATAGHLLRRLYAPTIETLRKSIVISLHPSGAVVDSDPRAAALQWFWFSSGHLVTQGANSDTKDGNVGSPRRVPIGEFVSAFQSGRTTIVLADRAEMEHVLSLVSDERICDAVRVFAGTPASRHIVVLTEALSLRFWAPSYLDTSKFDDWIQAVPSLSGWNWVNALTVLTQMCRYNSSFVPVGETDFTYCYRDAAIPDSSRLRGLETMLTRRMFSAGTVRFLFAEQMCREWTTLERFDPIHMAHSVATGMVAVATLVSDTPDDASIRIDTDTDVALSGDGISYMLLTVLDDGLSYVDVDCADIGAIEDHGLHRRIPVQVRRKHTSVSHTYPPLIGTHLMLDCVEDLDIERGYVTGDSTDGRWGPGGNTCTTFRETPSIPVDVVIAGNVGLQEAVS